MVNEHASRNSTDSRTGVGQTAYKRWLAYDYLKSVSGQRIAWFGYRLLEQSRHLHCFMAGGCRNAYSGKDSTRTQPIEEPAAVEQVPYWISHSRKI